MAFITHAVLPDAFTRIHEDLSRVARRYIRSHGTLDVPAVIAEVYLRLQKNGGPWQDTGHFYAVACQAAGQVVANYHRDQNRQRRGGDADHVAIHTDNLKKETITFSAFLDLQRALDALEQTTPRLARVVACRAVAGLSVEETACALDVGTATVKRDWRAARAFIARYLNEGGANQDLGDPS